MVHLRRAQDGLVSDGPGFDHGEIGRGRLSLVLSWLGLAVAVAVGAEHGADRDCVAGPDGDFREHAGRRRRHLDRDLVGLKLDQRLVGGDRVAGLLEPLADGRLDHGLTQARHPDLSRHARRLCLFGYPSASSRNVFSSRTCLLISPVAVAAELARPA